MEKYTTLWNGAGQPKLADYSVNFRTYPTKTWWDEMEFTIW